MTLHSQLHSRQALTDVGFSACRAAGRQGDAGPGFSEGDETERRGMSAAREKFVRIGGAIYLVGFVIIAVVTIPFVGVSPRKRCYFFD